MKFNQPQLLYDRAKQMEKEALEAWNIDHNPVQWGVLKGIQRIIALMERHDNNYHCEHCRGTTSNSNDCENPVCPSTPYDML